MPLSISFSIIRTNIDNLQFIKNSFDELGFVVKSIISMDESILFESFFPESLVIDAEHPLLNVKLSELPYQDISNYLHFRDSLGSSVYSLFERDISDYHGVSFLENRLYDSYSVALFLIQENNFDLCLFNFVPERGFDYIFYRLAKAHNIPCIAVNYGIFAHQVYSTLDIHSPYINDNGEISDDIFIKNNLCIDQRTDVLLNNLTNPYSTKVPIGISDLIKFNFSEFVRFHINAMLYLVFRKFYKRGCRNVNLITIKKSYFQHCINSNQVNSLIINGKSILFLLHYQPELTTIPLAKDYANQYLAIRQLSNLLPDFSIMVKEHPVTFTYRSKTTLAFRNSDFYRSLSSIPNVYLLSPDFDSLDLINKVDCVASIRGSVSTEAVLSGRKALIFSNSVYSNCPGIFQIKAGSKRPDVLHFLSSELNLSKVLNHYKLFSLNTWFLTKTYKSLTDEIVDLNKLVLECLVDSARQYLSRDIKKFKSLLP